MKKIKVIKRNNTNMFEKEVNEMFEKENITINNVTYSSSGGNDSVYFTAFIEYVEIIDIDDTDFEFK